ncbi:unnamed protein product [Cuscuta campestris]|uniref:Cathepsin propeptide inhibitor domain-containing protein n=1 Tax=Cuscuta campestris TaxID=132261 RepID=A0A484MY07_9ASTE|nr:unnamed protein product [Cuscuta campestris]
MAKLLLLSLIGLLSVIAAAAAADMSSIITYGEDHSEKGLAGRTDGEVMALYESWLAEHRKSYYGLGGEKEKRFQIFKDNLRYIDEQNSLGDRPYKLGLNRFSDLTNEEYRSTYLGVNTDVRRRFSKTKSDRRSPKVDFSLPESVDWREKGAVAEVKDQGSCGTWNVESKKRARGDSD